MQTALRTETTVLAGGRIEVNAPGLPEGATVEVIVVLPLRNHSAFLDSYATQDEGLYDDYPPR